MSNEGEEKIENEMIHEGTSSIIWELRFNGAT